MVLKQCLLIVAILGCGTSAQPTASDRLLALQMCAHDVHALCSTVPVTDLMAVAECLQAHRDDIATVCASVLEPFIRQEGEDGDIDQEVVDQETQEDEQQVEAEDEICDAKFIAACRTEFFAAVYSHDDSALRQCAQQNAHMVGQACVAMLEDGSADGLLTHMYRCGRITLNSCPVEALALSAEVIQGMEHVQTATLVSLISCLQGEGNTLRQGCSGFYESVSDILGDLADQASDQFNQEETEDPVMPVLPTPSPSDHGTGTDHSGDDTTPDSSGKDHSGDNTPPESPSAAPDTDTTPAEKPSDDDGSDHKSFLVPGILIALGTVIFLALTGAGAFYIYRRRNTSELVSMHVSMSDGPSQMGRQSDYGETQIMGSGYSRVEGQV